MNRESPPSSVQGLFPLLFVLGSWVLVFVASVNSYAPLEVRPASSPADQFSAERAAVILESLVGDSIPHPAGSPQNEIVRRRIVEMLESYGYEVEVQDGTGMIPERARHRSPDREQVDLHNIIAIRQARPNGSSTGNPTSLDQAIMLAAHYDSVPMGPGASDDGIGTSALLEIARMMASEPRPNRDVVFLITDGEEFGLMGAKMFVETHPLADRIGVVVNLEARGTTGPSMMFETSHQSRFLVSLFARTSPRPFSSSLFYEVYKRLPRDTDFTLFKRDGMLGYNFAIIGDVQNYHTETDTFENVDLRCLQHHGENGIGLIRGLLNSDELDATLTSARSVEAPAARGSTEAVYFDVFGRWLVWWPSSWSVWMSVVAILVTGLAAFRIPRPTNQELSMDECGIEGWKVAKQMAVQGLTIVAVVVFGYFIQAGVRLDSRLSNGWPVQPFPIMCGYWFASFALVGGIFMVSSPVVRPWSVWLAFSLTWLGLALLSSIFVNGASYLFIIPVITTSVCGLVLGRRGHEGMAITAVVAGVSIGLVWMPLERIFYDAVGFQMPVVTFFRISMFATSLPVLLSVANARIRFSFTILMTVLSVAALLIAMVANSEI